MEKNEKKHGKNHTTVTTVDSLSLLAPSSADSHTQLPPPCSRVFGENMAPAGVG